MTQMAAAAQGSRYHYKAERYSSHALLLAEFPDHGEGRRVLDVGCAVGYLSERGRCPIAATFTFAGTF